MSQGRHHANTGDDDASGRACLISIHLKVSRSFPATITSSSSKVFLTTNPLTTDHCSYYRIVRAMTAFWACMRFSASS